jgi:hypothetical protein
MSQDDGLGHGDDTKGDAATLEELANEKVKLGMGTMGVAVFGLGVLVIVGAAVWFWFIRDDPTAPHVRFQQDVMGQAQATYYTEFWSCALDAPVAEINKNTELIAAIHALGDGANAASYSEKLIKNEKCIPRLNEGVKAYRALKSNPGSPPEYADLLDDLAGRMEDLQKAWTAYAEYQATAGERDETRERIRKSGGSWIDFQDATLRKSVDEANGLQPRAVPYVSFISCLLGDVSYTSFVGEEGTFAQDKIAAAIDLRCDTERFGFIARMSECRLKAMPETAEPSDAFTAAATHWSAQQGDAASPEALDECIDRVTKERGGVLVEDIATAWEGYTKSYKALMSFSRSKSGGYIGPGH